MKRRTFLQTSSMAALGTLAFPPELLELKKVKKVGIQLYTVRDLMKEDAMGTLTKVAQIGYKNIESHGYRDGKVYGMTIAEFRKALDGLELETQSSHLGLELLRSENWERALADANVLGQKYVVCPSLPGNERKTIDQYKRIFDELNKAGEAAKKAGLQLAYHNHDFEFQSVDGQIPFEVMLKECDADLVKMELDLFWATKAGRDPITLFKNNPGRFCLWHVKDMANTAEKEFAPVGTGTIDFKKIFENTKTSGMEYFFVEQDSHRNKQPIENITNSYNYLKKLRF